MNHDQFVIATGVPEQQLCDRGLLGVASTGNAEAVEDCARRIGAIESVEVNSGNVVVQKIVTLFESKVDTDTSNAFRVIFASL